VFLQTEGADDGDATSTEAVSFNWVDKGAGERFDDEEIKEVAAEASQTHVLGTQGKVFH